MSSLLPRLTMLLAQPQSGTSRRARGSTTRLQASDEVPVEQHVHLPRESSGRRDRAAARGRRRVARGSGRRTTARSPRRDAHRDALDVRRRPAARGRRRDRVSPVSMLVDSPMRDGLARDVARAVRDTSRRRARRRPVTARARRQRPAARRGRADCGSDRGRTAALTPRTTPTTASSGDEEERVGVHGEAPLAAAADVPREGCTAGAIRGAATRSRRPAGEKRHAPRQSGDRERAQHEPRATIHCSKPFHLVDERLHERGR